MKKRDGSGDLDAVIAAPKHHRVLLENSATRVLETRIEPGETVPLHTHAWPGVHYLLSGGEFIRRDEQGRVTLDSRGVEGLPGAGQAAWSPPLGPHTLENVGKTAIHVITVEIKPGV